MNPNHPQFDAHRYTVHDLAKHVIIHEFERNGWALIVNQDTYGPDLVGRDPYGIEWTIEVEVKNNWQTIDFPYQTIHISHRKTKFNNDNHIHITCNADWTAYLIIEPEVLQAAKLVRKNTSYSRNELFLEIPINKCTIIERKNNA